MNLGRCPVCHASVDLAAMAEDEAGRELLALLAQCEAALGRALIAYLGLWRPAKHDLRWDRALRIAREALALDADPQRLAWALTETVESLRSKGDSRPLKTHGYLRRVLESAPAAVCAQPQEGAHVPRAASRTAQAMRKLISGV